MAVDVAAAGCPVVPETVGRGQEDFTEHMLSNRPTCLDERSCNRAVHCTASHLSTCAAAAAAAASTMCDCCRPTQVLLQVTLDWLIHVWLVTHISRTFGLTVRYLDRTAACLDGYGVVLHAQVMASPGAVDRVILDKVSSTLSCNAKKPC
jgi:hypothetical protein